MGVIFGNSIVKDGLIGYWPFGNDRCCNNTGDILDKSGSGNDMTFNSKPPRVDHNIDLIGTTTYFIHRNDTNLIGYNRGAFTASCFMRYPEAHATYSGVGMSKWNTGATPGTNEWSFGASGSAGPSAMGFNVAISQTTYSALDTENYVVGDWFYITGKFDGSKAYLYINNVFIDDIDAVGTVDTATGTPLMIGAFGTIGTYEGSADIAFPKLYNRCITDEEDARNFNAHRGLFGI